MKNNNKSCSPEDRERRKRLKNKYKEEENKQTPPKLVGIKKDERVYVDPYGRFEMTTF